MKKFVFIIAVLALLSFSIYFSLKFSNKRIVLSPISSTKPFVPILIPDKKETLKDVVEKSLADKEGKFAVVVKNLTTGQSYGSGENETYQAASLYKLWVMATAYSQIQKGQLKKDDVLNGSVSSLNAEFNIDSDSAEMTEGDFSISVGEALRRMIVNSENYPALLLVDRVGFSEIENFLNKKGVEHSSLNPPSTTAGDTAMFYEKLYRSQLADVVWTKEMMSLLGKQSRNNKLPKYLPSGVTVAHKTGELDTFSHDAGIVFGDKSNWIIVVMSDYGIPSDAEETIASLSKAVWQYFEE